MMRRSWVGALGALGLLVAGQQGAFAHDWSRDDTCGTGTYDAYFYPGGDPLDWYVSSVAAATGGCYMYTYAEYGGSSEAAIWYLPHDSIYNHTFAGKPKIPSNWGCTGDPVRYERWAGGTSNGVTSNHWVDQDALSAPTWTTALTGSFAASSSGSGYVKMVDLTNVTSQRVCADQFTYDDQ